MAVKRVKETTNSSFLPYLAIVEIVTPEGVIDLELPRLTTGKMNITSASVGALLNTLMNNAPDGMIDNLFSGNSSISGASIVRLLPQIFHIAFNEIIQLLSEYLDEPKEWVESLDTSEIVKILTPFFVSYLANMSPVLDMIGLNVFQNTQSGTQQTETEENKVVSIKPE
jgi:hypothetical protein